VQAYHIKKTASTDSPHLGEVVTYTITITNDSLIPYTVALPAVMNDDLTKVLDDADYNNDVAGGATYTEPIISWTGPLDVGVVVTIIYTMTVHSTRTGDGQLDNGALAPAGLGSNCPPGSTDVDCNVSLPLAADLAETGVNQLHDLSLGLLVLAFGLVFTVLGARPRRRNRLASTA
jgi:uncharacterized repeat protein (TIGR01451 family)